MEKRIRTAVGIIGGAVDLWAIASFIDIIANNLDAAPVFKAWNLFVLLF